MALSFAYSLNFLNGRERLKLNNLHTSIKYSLDTSSFLFSLSVKACNHIKVTLALNLLFRYFVLKRKGYIIIIYYHYFRELYVTIIGVHFYILFSIM